MVETLQTVKRTEKKHKQRRRRRGAGGAPRRRSRLPLTEKQKRAAQIFLETASMTETAAAVGVHRSTLWRWGKRNDFWREVERVQASWEKDFRRRMRKEIIESPEHQAMLAARRRLKSLGEKISEAGDSGNLKAYNRAVREYDKCLYQAYPGSKDLFFSKKSNKRKKSREPVKYIVKIIR